MGYKKARKNAKTNGLSTRCSESKSRAGAQGRARNTPAQQEAARRNGKLGGAPTLYRSEYSEQLKTYFDRDPTRTVKRTLKNKRGTLVTAEERLPCEFPTLQGFCRIVGISNNTLRSWARRRPEFKDAVEFAKTCQADILIVNGLLGYYKQSVSILFARTNLGWRK